MSLFLTFSTTFVPLLDIDEGRYAIATFTLFPSMDGAGQPLLTSPICSPLLASMTVVWLRAGGPWLTSPTRFLVGLSLSWRKIISAPGKSSSLFWMTRLRFPIVHVKPASIGVVSSSISLPYKHKPASSRKESRAPKPDSCTLPSVDESKVSVTSVILSSMIDNSNPSSPV